MTARPLLGAALAAAMGLGGSAQQPTFRASVELVRVDVSVTADGTPVRGLGADDFEIRDDGVRQRIERVVVEEVPLQVWLVLDASHSVRGEPQRQLIEAASAFLGGLRQPDRAALLTFAHQVALRQPLTADVAAVGDALETAPAAGSTSVRDALYAALRLAEPTRDRAVAVVFSDGRDNVSWLRPNAVLEAARRTEVIVQVVTPAAPAQIPGVVWQTPGRLWLGEVAGATGGRLWDVGQAGGVRAAFLRVLEDLRTRYLLTYSPTDEARPGWHRLEVRLLRGRGTVRARQGYYRSAPR